MGLCMSIKIRVDSPAALQASTSCSYSSFDTTNTMGTRWKSFVDTTAERDRFVKEKSLPNKCSDSMLEFRLFLDDPELLRPLLDNIKGATEHSIVMCWMDIQEFKQIHPESIDQQRCSALNIYNNYIQVHCNTPVALINTTEEKSVCERLLATVSANEKETPLPRGIFNVMQRRCFSVLYKKVWRFYRHGAFYIKAIESLREYNKINVDDFRYVNMMYMLYVYG